MRRLARLILRGVLPGDLRDTIVSDLDAEFDRRGGSSGWYWRQVAGSIGPALLMRARRLARAAADAGQDARFGVRLLARDKTFTIASVLTLALGIGATTCIFSLVDRVLLRPLPYAEPSRLIRIWSANPRGIPRGAIAPADFFDWREQSRSFEQLAAYTDTDVTLTSAGDPVQLPATQVTANLAATLGVTPMIGRWFVPDETGGDGQPVVVLGDALWRSRFGAASAIEGRTIVIDGIARTVVGVMPGAFAFPSRDVQLWLPLPDTWRGQTRSARFLAAVGRLAPGVTVDAAAAELRTIAQRLESAFADSNRGYGVTVASLAEALVGNVRRPLIVLFAASLAMLLIACANVSGLMLARGAARTRELAIRAAVGASASRLLRQQLVEAMLLAVLGGAAAVLAAAWGIGALRASLTLVVPFLDRVAMDGRVLAAATAITVTCAIVSGLFPAWRASRQQGSEALARGTRTTTGHVRVRQAIVVTQIAVATALACGALLLARSLERLTSVPAGFAADRTLLADVSLPTRRYKPDQRAPFFDRALDRLRAMPGIQAAGAGGPLPLSGQEGLLRFGVTQDRRSDPERAYVRWATPGYFAAMGIAQRSGRAFAAGDRADSTPVAVIDEALARRLFAQEDPVGRRIQLSMNRGVWREVVGVVGAVHQTSLDRPAEPHVYLPETQLASSALTIVVRGGGDPSSVAAAVRSAIDDIDPELALSNVRTLADLAAGSTRPQRQSTLLLGVFAAAAVLLTLIGVYGVIAQIVAQSTRELGVRLALGRRAGSIVALTVRRALVMAAIGVAGGTTIAVLAAPVLRSMLYGIGPRDPLTFVLVSAVLLTSAAFAAYLPARRILRLDVLATLRVE